MYSPSMMFFSIFIDFIQGHLRLKKGLKFIPPTKKSFVPGLNFCRPTVPSPNRHLVQFFVTLRIWVSQLLVHHTSRCQRVKADRNIYVKTLTDTGAGSKLVHRRKRPKVDASIFLLFFRHVRATSRTRRRVENTGVHFWTFSPVSVNDQVYY